MKLNKVTISKSFWQLLLIYSLACILISLGIIKGYFLHFSILAIIIALFGSISLDNPKRMFTNERSNFLILFAFTVILAARIHPYLENNVPLGYDPGLYRYAIENSPINYEDWVFMVHEPGFLYTVNFLKNFFSSDFILIWLFILINFFLGVSIYLCAKVHFNKDAAALSLLIFSLSVIQFKAYWFMYYRNIIGLIFMLMAFYSLRLNKKTAFVIYSILLGWFHKPTFFIFGLTYFAYSVIKPFKKGKYDLEKLKNNVVQGIIILLGFISLYLGRFKIQILTLISPVITSFIEPGNASGTFISFFTYKSAALPYLALSLLGFFYTLRKKEYSILTYFLIVNSLIVIMEFFFFNRFIISMDIALILFFGMGMMLILNERKLIGIIAVTLLIFSAIISVTDEIKSSKPLVTEDELELIKSLKTTEENAYVLSTSSYYSPWLLYSEKKVIAPGLFDYDYHTKEEWIGFWDSENIEEIKLFMKDFPRPLYVYSGSHQENTMEKFPECFELSKEGEGKIYRVIC